MQAFQGRLGPRKGSNPPSHRHCWFPDRPSFCLFSRTTSALERGVFVPARLPVESPAASAELPARPDLGHLKKQAKDLLKAHGAGDRSVCESLRHLPRFAKVSEDTILAADLTLHDVQSAVARAYGFPHWAALRDAVAGAASASSAASSRVPAPRLHTLDETIRKHIEILGFATVGAYRIWCHKQGFDSAIDKTEAQLYDELVHHQQEPDKPTLRPDYRPAEARKITQAFRRAPGKLWDGWRRPFEGVEDEAEREALHRLLLHCAKYAAIGGPIVWQVARHYRDWRHPVEEWIPRGQSEKAHFVDLVRFLLGRDDLPAYSADRLTIETPSDHHARARSSRETVFTAEEMARFEERGHLLLKGVLERETAAEILDFMWLELDRMHGFKHDDPQTWKMEGWSPDRQPYSWTQLRLNRSKDHSIYEQIGSQRMIWAIEELMGEKRASAQQSWGGFGVTFPSHDQATPWELGTAWACYGHPMETWQMAVQVFFTDTQPRGGGLLVVEGSHRLVRAYFEGLKPSDRLQTGQSHIHRFYQQYPYFAELTGLGEVKGDRIRRFMEETTVVDGVPLRVVELIGEPGDAVFYHRSAVYARSRNTTDRPAFTRG